jgi:hypothetical protein
MDQDRQKPGVLCKTTCFPPAKSSLHKSALIVHEWLVHMNVVLFGDRSDSLALQG